MPETPFGNIGDTTKPLAPTPVEVAADPGKWDGTSFDPLIRAVAKKAVINYGSYPEGEEPSFIDWAAWYRDDPRGAMAWSETGGALGRRLNLSKLSAGQKERMGIK